MMASCDPISDMPESSESKQDVSLTTLDYAVEKPTKPSPHRNSYPREVAVISTNSFEVSNQETREHAPRRNPKHVTGVHRDVRATSTDAEQLTLPVPDYDEPRESTPGESENPAHDFEEDLIEDAYDD